MFDAAWNAQQKLSETRPTALPKDATPEQIAAYRKENGIPEKADGYLEAVKDLNIPEGDREIIAPYLPIMHKHNLSPEVAKELIATRQAETDRQIEARIAEDKKLSTEWQEELRTEWGNQYRGNVANIKNLLTSRFGEEGMERLLTAREPNGDLILDNPGILRALAQLAIDVNGGAPTITTADGTSIADLKGATARKGELEKMMGDSTSEYYKGPNAAKLQQEYRDIVDYELRQKARAA